MKMKKKTL